MYAFQLTPGVWRGLNTQDRTPFQLLEVRGNQLLCRGLREGEETYLHWASPQAKFEQVPEDEVWMIKAGLV
jgi:hypothetical protein